METSRSRARRASSPALTPRHTSNMVTSVENSPETLPMIKPNGNISFSGGRMNCEPINIEIALKKYVGLYSDVSFQALWA